MALTFPLCTPTSATPVSVVVTDGPAYVVGWPHLVAPGGQTCTAATNRNRSTAFAPLPWRPSPVTVPEARSRSISRVGLADRPALDSVPPSPVLRLSK